MKTVEEKRAAYEAKRQALLARQARADELERLRRQQERELAALKVQSKMRGLWATRRAEDVHRKRQAARREVERRQREANAATTIQTMFRTVRDRRQLEILKRQAAIARDKAEVAEEKAHAIEAESEALEQDKWIEYWDESAEAYYWFNPRTQEARWDNPNATDTAATDDGYESAYTDGTATDYDTDNHEFGTESVYTESQYGDGYSEYGSQSTYDD